MEITQGIQGNPILGDDTTSLIPGRSTAIRLYVDSPCGSPVYGYLRTWDGSGFEAAAENGPLPLSGWPINRKDENHSLNFTFVNPPVMSDMKFEAVVSYVPPQWAHQHPPFDDCTGSETGGTLAFFRPAEALFGGFLRRMTWTTTSCFEKTVEFIELRQPNFEAIPVDYQFPDWEGDPLPSDELAESGADMMWAGWPIPDAGGGSYTYFSSRPIRAVTDLDRSPIHPTLDFVAELDRIRCAEGRADYLFAWTPEDLQGGGQAGIRAALGDATPYLHRANYAHELGHLFYGTDDHTNEPTSGQVGWDVLARMADIYGKPHVRNGNILSDLMRASGQSVDGLMVPRQHYEAAIETTPSLYAPDTSACPPEDKEEESYRLVSGYVQNDFPVTGTLHAAAPMTGTVSTAPILGGNAQIKLLDSSFNLQYETSFDRGGTGLKTFMRSLPVYTDTHRVELHTDGVLLDAITRTLNVPVLTVTSPQPSASLTDTLLVKWMGSDADNDPLTAHALYSHDGTAWYSLGIGRSTDTLTIGTQGLGSSTDAVVRVTMHDGFNATTVDVRGLTLLPNRVPVARITSPRNAITVPYGVSVSLTGSAHDPEDGNLEGSSITWTSSIDGHLGSDDAINIGGHAAGSFSTALSSGTHIILLEAADSTGAKGTDSVTVVVE